MISAGVAESQFSGGVVVDGFGRWAYGEHRLGRRRIGGTMKALNLWNCTMMGALILIVATCSFAQDWPQWRGDNRDGKVTGFNAPQAWPAALKQVWKVTVGVGDSTPALVGDRLYVFTRQGEDEVTLCLDAKTGTEAWRDKYAAQPVAGPASRHPGPRSSPAVADGKVVTLGVAGVLSCLDAAKGAPVWRKDPFPGVVPEFFSAMSPIIVDGMALAHLGGPGNGAFIAFDLNTGDEKWRWRRRPGICLTGSVDGRGDKTGCDADGKERRRNWRGRRRVAVATAIRSRKKSL